MVRTMTKGALSSSSGAWLLFLGVALLLPTVIMGESAPRDCKNVQESAPERYRDHIVSCPYDEEFCVTRWRLDEKPGTPTGCASKEKFSEDHGFELSDGACKESKRKRGEFICTCKHAKERYCNNDKLGEGKAKKWREGKTAKTKGGSSGLFPSTTFFAALTFAAILAC